MDRDALIAELRHQGIRDKAVLRAMATVPRDRFVPARHRRAAWENHPLPIGWQQTISQPFIVALMTQLLGLRPGDNVLDVGTGCGYQAAVLAELGCRVWGIEVVADLAHLAQANLTGTGYDVDVALGDGSRGRPEHAPYDGIVVAAAASRIPSELEEQLRPPTADRRGGRMILPVTDAAGQRLVLVQRLANGCRRDDLERVRFVPLVRGADHDITEG